jgi:hypothetical protein
VELLVFDRPGTPDRAGLSSRPSVP